MNYEILLNVIAVAPGVEEDHIVLYSTEPDLRAKMPFAIELPFLVQTPFAPCDAAYIVELLKYFKLFIEKELFIKMILRKLFRL